MKESRRAYRVSCFVPVLCSAGRKTDRAMVLDVSSGGMRVRTSRRLKTGAVITLHYPVVAGEELAPRLEARVVWTRTEGNTFEAGLDCPAEQIFWVPILLSKLAPAEKKKDSSRKTSLRRARQRSPLCG